MIKQFSIEQVGDVLQRMHDSEINIKIHWVQGGGIDWEIRDEQNGSIESSRVNASISNPEWGKIDYSITALAYEIYRLFPKSDFGKWYSTLNTPVPLERVQP